jgi:hypothetical protein
LSAFSRRHPFIEVQFAELSTNPHSWKKKVKNTTFRFLNSKCVHIETLED